MPNSSDCVDITYEVLRRLRDARRDFHTTIAQPAGTRERVFAAPQLLRTLHEQIARSTAGTPHERCGKLFVLTVLLYGALDWQFAGHGIDIEADVQIERIRQDQSHGGPAADDQLSAEEWRTRLQQQVRQLEQQLAYAEGYAVRLVKVTALAQAALEATYRQARQG